MKMASKKNSVCGRCSREVYHAEQRLAINKVWHLFCFSCAICNKLLDSCTVNPYNGEIYCNPCFHRVSAYDYDFDNENSRRGKLPSVKSYQQINKRISHQPSPKMQYPRNKPLEKAAQLTRNQNTKFEAVTKPLKQSESKIRKKETQKTRHEPFENDSHSGKRHKSSGRFKIGPKIHRCVCEDDIFDVIEPAKNRLAPDASDGSLLERMSQTPERTKSRHRVRENYNSSAYKTPRKRHDSNDIRNQSPERTRSRHRVERSRSYNNRTKRDRSRTDRMYQWPDRARTRKKSRENLAKNDKTPKKRCEPFEDEYRSCTRHKSRGSPSTKSFKIKYHGPSNRANTWTTLGQDEFGHIIRGLYKNPKYRVRSLDETDDYFDNKYSSPKKAQKDKRNERNRRNISNLTDVCESKTNNSSSYNTLRKHNRDIDAPNRDIDAPNRANRAPNQRSLKTKKDTPIPNSSSDRSLIRNPGQIYYPAVNYPNYPNRMNQYRTVKSSSSRSLKHKSKRDRSRDKYNQSTKNQNSPNRTIDERDDLTKPAKSHSRLPRNKSFPSSKSLKYRPDRKTSEKSNQSTKNKHSPNRTEKSNASRLSKHKSKTSQTTNYRNTGLYKPTKSNSPRLSKHRSSRSLKDESPVHKTSENPKQHRKSRSRTDIYKPVKSNSSKLSSRSFKDQSPVRKTSEKLNQNRNPTRTDHYKPAKSNSSKLSKHRSTRSLKDKSPVRKTSENFKQTRTDHYQTAKSYSPRLAKHKSHTSRSFIDKSPVRKTSGTLHQTGNYRKSPSRTNHYKTTKSYSPRLTKHKSHSSRSLKDQSPVRKTNEILNRTHYKTPRLPKQKNHSSRSFKDISPEPKTSEKLNQNHATKSNSSRLSRHISKTSEKSNQTTNYPNSPNIPRDAYNDLYQTAIKNAPKAPKNKPLVRSTIAKLHQTTKHPNPGGKDTYKASRPKSTSKQPSPRLRSPKLYKTGKHKQETRKCFKGKTSSIELYRAKRKSPKRDTIFEPAKAPSTKLDPKKARASPVTSEFYPNKDIKTGFTRQTSDPYKSANSVQLELEDRKKKGFFSRWFSCRKDKKEEEQSDKIFDKAAFINKKNTFKEKSKYAKLPMDEVELKYYKEKKLKQGHRNKLNSPENSERTAVTRYEWNRRKSPRTYSMDKRYRSPDRHRQKSARSQTPRGPKRNRKSALDRAWLNPHAHQTIGNNRNHIQYFADVDRNRRTSKYGSEIGYGDKTHENLLDTKDTSMDKPGSRSTLVPSPRLVSGYYSRNFKQRLRKSRLPIVDFNDAKPKNDDRCKRCKRMVYVVEKVKAGRSTYHDCCFTCYMCRRPLNSLNMLSRKSEVFCKHCHLKYYGPQTYGYGILPNLSF